ncbi:alanine-zipper protein [Enterococcus italicus]|uniref:alanine-zipper protein n=1 Tax=Enterococcus italicus TaxID=246144 RepID=UPI0028AF9127|nr:alanine-zipper protein [Enterococcus italicus]
MILYFYDRFFNPLGKAASNLPKGIYYTDDKQVDDVQSGTSTFEFYLEFDAETRDLTKTYADKSFYIVAKDEDEETRVWQIIDDESDEEAMTRYFYCEDAGMDLINETLPAWTAPSSAQKVAYYVNKAIYDSGFEIGNNEIDNLTRTLNWDGETTALARLQSILTQFDNAEFRFRFVIDENTLELLHKYIDIYQKVGAETGIQLRYGREVKNIKVKRSKANLVNAYRCYGATPNGKNAPINLTGYTLSTSQKEINADTGKARFVLSGNILKDTASNAKYSRYLNPSEQGEDLGYYTGIYQGTAQTQKGLADEVIRKLKQTGEIEVNYEVELLDAPRTLSIGDYVYVVNDADELYLEGRILQIERSRANDTFDITLGDYLIQSSGINAQLQALADQIASLNASKNYNYTISTTNGWSFKNSEGSTTLSAVIRDNIVDVTDVFTIEWYKDGVQVATSATLTVKASDIVDKAVYKYLAKNDDGEVVGQSEVTISNIDETKIIRQDNPPLADANTIWIDSSNQINELDVAKIYNQLKDDWVRVTPTLPSEVGAFSYESGIALTNQTSQLSKDAEEMRKNADQIRLDMQKAREELEADLVELQEDVDAKNSDMTQLINSNKVDTDKVLTDANTAIVDANKKIASTDENVTNINTSITNINNELATKVAKEEVNTLNQTVSNQATEIKQNADLIALKADSQTVDALNQTVINQSTLIEQNAEAIALKASTTDVNAVKETVTAHDSKLTQTAKDITSLVTKTDDTNTALSEVKQTADAITTKIGAIEEDADSTSTKLSELEQNVNGFKTTVSNTYETKQNVDAKANKALEDAKDYAISQIAQTASSITQTVSETYATQQSVASQIEQKAGSITQTIAANYSSKNDTEAKIGTALNTAKSDTDEKLSKLGTFKRYSWSPDGKDRFTKYNVRNLLPTIDSSNDIVKIKQSNWIDKLDKHGNKLVPVKSWEGIVINMQTLVSVGSIYTYSILVTNETDTDVDFSFYNNGVFSFDTLDKNLIAKAQKTERVYVVFKLNDISAINDSYSRFEATNAQASGVYQSSPVLVEGDFTDYLSLVDRDYDNAIPRYIGRSLKDSNNPDDYKYEVNPDRKPWTGYMQELDGTGFSKVPYGENLITKSLFQSDTKEIYSGDSTSGFLTNGNLNSKFLGKPKVSFSAQIEVLTNTLSVDSNIYLRETNGAWRALSNQYLVKIGETPTFTVSGTYDFSRISSFGSIGVAGYSTSGTGTMTVKITKLSVKIGEDTQYTPAPGDDKLASIPKYIGYAPLPSDSYSDYAWQLNPAWLEVNTETIVTDKYSQSVQDLDGFRNTVGATYQTKDAMTGYYNKTETNSQINQKAGEITSTVSSTYTTQNDFNSLKNKTDWKAITSAQDLNNLTNTGKYWIQADHNTNSPTNAWIYVTVDAPQSDRIKQTVQQDNSVSGYWERTYNGSWSDWRKMSDESWVNSQIKQTADSITSTVSDTYETKQNVATNLNTAKSYAETQANNALSLAKSDATNKANDAKNQAIASAKVETASQVKQLSDSITSTVAATYTPKSDFDILGDTVLWKKLSESQDLNNLTKSGKYWLEGTENINSPIVGWQYLIVDAPNSVTSRIRQTVKSDNHNQETWERSFYGQWTDWIEAADTVYVNSQIKQTADSITSTVSQKVGKTEVISTINQSAESVTINASKINLQGALTISQFSTSDRDKINNGISTANTANSTANTAQNKANDAYNLANTANGTANTANNQVNSWKKSGTTMIDGGNIYADSLSVISSNMGILETYYNSDWNGKLRIEGATIRGFMNTNSKLLEKSRYYPDAIEYYTHDSSGNWLNSFRLDTGGIRNDNSSYGKRRIGFKDEGIVIQADSGNSNYGSPNYLNSGIELVGKSSYIDFHDSASSTADYKSRIVHNHDSKPNQLWMLNSVGGVIIESNQAGINIDGTITLRSNSGVLAQNTNASAWVDIRAKGFVQSSAYSLKTNFKDLSTAELLEAIDKTDIVEYQFKDDVKNGRSDKYVGMILNDDGNSPYKTSSILANEDNTAYSTTTAVGVMMGAIKELSKQNKELQAKVDTLYSFIESIDLNKITK